MDRFGKLRALFCGIVFLFALAGPLAWAQEEPPEESKVSSYELLPEYLPRDIERRFGSLRIDANLVDAASAAYRTGLVDPAVEAVPAELAAAMKKDPKANLARLVAYFKKGAKDEYHLVKRFHDWIDLHVAYDYDAFNGRAKGSQAVEDVIKNGRTTCGGFANLLKALCDEAKVECKYLSGISRRYIDNIDDPAAMSMAGHAWNAVRIKGTWYVVDSTADTRRSYDKGKFGELKVYRDGALFLSPEAKLLSNAATNLDDQLVPEPLSALEFLGKPLINDTTLRDGIFLDLGGLGGDFVKVAKKLPDGGRGYMFDAWYPPASGSEFLVTHPRAVSLRVSLKDLATGKTRSYAAATILEEGLEPLAEGADPYAERALSRIRVELPGPGVYEFFLYSGRPSGKDPTMRQAYSFLIIVDDKKTRGPFGGIALVEGSAVPAHAYAHLGLPGESLERRELRVPALDEGWVYFDVATNKATEYYAWLSDASGASIKSATAVSVLGGGKTRYYFKRQRGPAVATLAAKKAGGPSYSHTVSLALVPGWGKDAVLAAQPRGELMIRPLFWESKLSLASPPIIAGGPVASIEMGIPKELRVRAFVKGPDGKDLGGHAALYRGEGDVHRFALGKAAGGEALATIYVYDAAGKGNSAASILLPATSPEGPVGALAVYPHGKLLALRDPIATQASVALEGESAGADFALSYSFADGYEGFVSLYTRAGTQITGDGLKGVYQTSYPSTGKRIMYFLDKIEGGYYCIVYVRKKGDKDYRAAYGLGRWEKADPARTLVVTAPMCAAKFTELGLTLVGFSAAGGKAELRFAGPATLKPSAMIADAAGKKAAGFVNFRYADGLWIFTFEYPAGTPSPVAKLYAKDAAGKSWGIASVPLPAWGAAP